MEVITVCYEAVLHFVPMHVPIGAACQLDMGLRNALTYYVLGSSIKSMFKKVTSKCKGVHYLELNYN